MLGWLLYNFKTKENTKTTQGAKGYVLTVSITKGGVKGM
jgi:hypothetical protein